MTTLPETPKKIGPFAPEGNESSSNSFQNQGFFLLLVPGRVQNFVVTSISRVI